MKIMLVHFSEEVGRGDVFKSAIGDESVHEINNDKGARVVNFAISENIIVKSKMFQYCNIHKYNGSSPYGKTHNKTDVLTVKDNIQV
jgi:hypothetical protein